MEAMRMQKASAKLNRFGLKHLEFLHEELQARLHSAFVSKQLRWGDLSAVNSLLGSTLFEFEKRGVQDRFIPFSKAVSARALESKSAGDAVNLIESALHGFKSAAESSQ